MGIPGMPGTANPDVLIVTKTALPSLDLLQSLLDNGYYLSGCSPIDEDDFWFWKRITDPGLVNNGLMTLHVVNENCKAGLLLLTMRDKCRSEEWAFEDYKSAKIGANESAEGNFLKYKMTKGKKSKLLQQLRAQFDMVPSEMPLS